MNEEIKKGKDKRNEENEVGQSGGIERVVLNIANGILVFSHGW